MGEKTKVKEERDILYNETKIMGFMHTMHRYFEIRMEHILTRQTQCTNCRTYKTEMSMEKNQNAKVATTQNHLSVEKFHLMQFLPLNLLIVDFMLSIVSSLLLPSINCFCICSS